MADFFVLRMKISIILFPFQRSQRALSSARLSLGGSNSSSLGSDLHDGLRLHHSGHLLRQVSINQLPNKCQCLSACSVKDLSLQVTNLWEKRFLSFEKRQTVVHCFSLKNPSNLSWLSNSYCPLAWKDWWKLWNIVFGEALLDLYNTLGTQSTQVLFRVHRPICMWKDQNRISVPAMPKCSTLITPLPAWPVYFFVAQLFSLVLSIVLCSHSSILKCTIPPHSYGISLLSDGPECFDLKLVDVVL